MARLPTPGSDNGTWGDILNNFLSEAHTSDGSLKTNSVGSSQLQSGSVTNAKIATGTISEAKLDSSVQTKLNASGGPVLSTDITDSTATGRAVLTAASAAAARTAIGAGTVNTAADIGLDNVDNTSDATKNSAVATLTNKTIDNSNIITVRDDRFTIQDNLDPTKQARFEISGLSSGVTNTYTLPLGSTLVDTSSAQTLSNKTISEPQVNTGGSIRDLNGNEILTFTNAGSPVNQIRVGSASSGSAPTVEAMGDDPDVNLNLLSKGTGIVQANGVAVATISGVQTITNKTIDGDNNTISNLDLGNEVDWAAIGDVSDAGAFTSGDKLLIFEAGVGMRKIDYDDLPSGSGDMAAATYDPAGVSEQLVGLTATQALTNKTLTMSAGTTSVAPLNFTSGTNLTTATAGAVEYDGTAFYATAVASTRQVVDTEQFMTLTSDYTLTSQTAAQKMFNASSNGAVTLAVGTYFFECNFYITNMTAGSSFGWDLTAGTATIAGIGWWSIAKTSDSAITYTYNTAANTNISSSGFSSTGWAQIRGKLRISSAGTVIPQVNLSAAAAAVIKVDSYFRISSVGSNTVTNVGNWS